MIITTGLLSYGDPNLTFEQSKIVLKASQEFLKELLQDKLVILFHKNVNILYHMKTLG